MITFKDFEYAKDLEKYQVDNNVKTLKIETVQKEKYKSEYFTPGFKYTSGRVKYNVARLYYEKEDCA